VRLRRLRLRVRRGRSVSERSRQEAGQPDTQPPVGLHAYTRQSAGGQSRLHLRVEPDGRGLLLVNADRAVHLNPTATLMAWMQLEGLSEAQAVAQLRRRFRAPAQTLRQDFQNIRFQIDELARPDGACPIHALSLEVMAPFSSEPLAPYRMDLALTYRCNNECPHCYNARPRDFAEVGAEEWRTIIDRLWDAGVPHICFTGGEATLRSDLPDLVGYAEAKGQITGLLTNGRRLSDRTYVAALAAAGLDHVQITLESAEPETHDRMVASRGAWKQTVGGVRNALEAGLFLMTNTTLLAENAGQIRATLDFLAELGVPTVGLNALIHAGRGRTVGSGLPEGDLAPLLEIARERTAHHGQRLIWYTPTQYCNFDPVQMELGVKGCTAARYNMCVEPDGGVIPCQSYYQQVGNLLRDSWESIWNNELCLWLRQRGYAPEACNACAFFSECGGGCPLSLRGVRPTDAMRAERVTQEG